MTQVLQDRVAIVTGAGSLPGRGIGRQVTINLASKGARVLAVDINEETANQTAEACRAAGYEAIAHRADVSKPSEIKAMVAAALERFGRLDILVNHAGVGSYMGLTETDDEHWNRMIAINLTSPFIASREAVPHMLKNATGGVILNTISTAGLAGGRAGTGYTAAKHGMVGLTRSIAATYAKRGIRCVGVCPGYTRSPLPEGAMPPQIAISDKKDEAVQLFEGIAQLGAREGRPEELASVIAFLATDEASFVNGAIIAVDGGWTAI